MTRTPLTPVERAVRNRKKVIARLTEDIRRVKTDAAVAINTIERKIQIQQALIVALENGTLRP